MTFVANIVLKLDNGLTPIVVDSSLLIALILRSSFVIWGQYGAKDCCCAKKRPLNQCHELDNAIGNG